MGEVRPLAEVRPLGEARRVGRRVVLLGGAAVAVGGIVGVAAGVVPLARTIGAAGQRVPEPIVRVERVWSRARGREVGLVTVLPTELPIKGLPVCLFLHGRGGTAETAFPSSLGKHLVRQVAHDKVEPFAFVSVDGGDNYWHERVPGDDPMRMLLAEVPAWLAARHLGRVFAVAGVSMGGFGALVYARRRAERGDPVRAAAAISPALISWEQMRKRRAFRSEQEWLALDPRHNIPPDTPLAVWCGTQDPFAPGTREFIELADPEVGYLGPGGHDPRFYNRVVPGLVEFLAGHR